MGRRATSGGVEIRSNSIRLRFTHAGKRQVETLKAGGQPLEPTPANVTMARRLSATIASRIKLGTFDREEFFPTAKAEPAADTFDAVAAQWIKSKGQLEAATKDQYATGVRRWKKIFGDAAPMESLTYQHLAATIGGHEWPSPKAANNYLIVLRGIMGFYYSGQRAAQNPMLGIENLRVVKKKPDPLTAAERDRILADMREHYDPRVPSYFTFAFYTGMRPEEIIALQWGDIDEAAAVVRVARVRTFKGTERDGTKTGQERDVDLLPQAMAALHEMRHRTSMKSAYIFENPLTGEPWHDERSQRDTYWKPCLKRLRIRQRRAYCTRHTYATVALMGGVNPAYVSAQMGHSSTKMFFETYARWIDGADKGVQRAAMAAAFGDLAQVWPQAAEQRANSMIQNKSSGRRDWIRTKAPGHEGYHRGVDDEQ